MTGEPAHQTPEEQHLADQEHLLAELSEQLISKETEFATTGAEFARFREAYLRRFAPLYRELDDLEAQIARLLALEERTPEANEKAESAEQRAAESEEAARLTEESAASAPSEELPRAVDPELRDLYRRAAKLVHPDTAGSNEERERRTRVMAAVNEAYERGDAAAIQRIVDGEGARPEAIEGDDVASRLIRVLRQLAQIRARFTELVQLQTGFEADDMWKLFSQSRAAWAAGEDPLDQDEAALRTQIASARSRLAALVMAQSNKRRPSAT
jgi:hypothetical protein